MNYVGSATLAYQKETSSSPETLNPEDAEAQTQEP